MGAQGSAHHHMHGVVFRVLLARVALPPCDARDADGFHEDIHPKDWQLYLAPTPSAS
jgi:hypothetical protein